MTVILTFFITKPQHFSATKQLVETINKECKVQCAVLTTHAAAHSSHCPSGFQPVDDLESIIGGLINKHLHTIISDEILDVNNPNVCMGYVNFSKQTLKLNGKEYGFGSNKNADLTFFAIDLIKLRSDSTPTGIQYNDDMFIFSAQDEFRYTTITQTPVNLWMHNQTPVLFMNWHFSDSSTFCKQFLRLTDKIILTSDASKATHTVVVNQAFQLFPAENTLYFCMEPHGDRLYHQYLQALCSQDMPLYFGLHDFHLNLGEWHLSWSYHKLLTTKVGQKTKDKALSIVMSAKRSDPGQHYRLSLVEALDKRTDLPFQLDIYGRCESLKFKNYRGELPDNKKDAALFPYKYQLNVENNYISNYITEKLYDGMCAETLTFYKGAPNTSTFFDPNSHIELSGKVENISQDIDLICESIKNDEYTNRLSAIKANKRKFLNCYAFEPRIQGILKILPTLCVTIHSHVGRHLQQQSFKNVKQISPPVNFFAILSECVTSGKGIFFRLSDKVRDNEFDKLAFASMDHPHSDGYVFGELIVSAPFDLFLTPKGIEQVMYNVQRQTPNPFHGLKIQSI